MKIKKLLCIAYFEYYTLNKINFKNIMKKIIVKKTRILL